MHDTYDHKHFPEYATMVYWYEFVKDTWKQAFLFFHFGIIIYNFNQLNYLYFL